MAPLSQLFKYENFSVGECFQQKNRFVWSMKNYCIIFSDSGMFFVFPLLYIPQKQRPVEEWFGQEVNGMDTLIPLQVI